MPKTVAFIRLTNSLSKDTLVKLIIGESKNHIDITVPEIVSGGNVKYRISGAESATVIGQIKISQNEMMSDDILEDMVSDSFSVVIRNEHSKRFQCGICGQPVFDSHRFGSVLSCKFCWKKHSKLLMSHRCLFLTEHNVTFKRIDTFDP